MVHAFFMCLCLVRSKIICDLVPLRRGTCSSFFLWRLYRFFNNAFCFALTHSFF